MELDLKSVGVVLLILGVGGFTAYIADHFGRTMGKKRLRLGKMRPRHTAALLTVVLGMLVSLVTFAAIYASSNDVRQWLRRGTSIITELRQLQEEKASLISQKEQLLKDNRTARADFDKISKQKNQLTSDVAALNSKVRKLQANVADYRKRETAAAHRLQGLLTRFSGLTKQYGALDANYKSLNTSYKTIHDQYSEVLHKNKELLDENSNLEKQKETLSGQADTLRSEISNVQKELSTSKGELEATKGQLETLKGQLETTGVQLENAQRDLENIKMLSTRLLVGVQSQRGAPLTYAIGEELARVTVPPSSSEDDARTTIDTVLRQARVAASARGASSKDGGPEAAFVDLPQGTGPDVTYVTVAQQEAGYINSLTKATGPVVVIAKALLNSFKGEPVPIRLYIFRNPMIYQQGDILAETRIDGTLGDDALTDQVTNFIQSKVKERAIKDNMIPASGREDSIGKVSLGQIVSLVTKIKAFNRTVKVDAYAKSDTRAAGPLELEFRVR